MQPSCKFKNTPRVFCLSLALACAASLLPAQNAASGSRYLAPAQCVWRAGDNPAWSAAALDESGWQPLASWELAPAEPHISIRCHLDRETLGGLNHPAVEIREFAAWELYLDGARLGGNGSLESGEFGLNTIRILPVPLSKSSGKRMFLRCAFRDDSSNLLREPTRYRFVLARNNCSPTNVPAMPANLPETLTEDLPFIVLGLVGLVALVFTVGEKARPEAILIGINLAAAGVSFMARLSWETMWNGAGRVDHGCRRNCIHGKLFGALPLPLRRRRA